METQERATMQPYVKMWYDYFADGKIMGLKCADCGGYEFPPVPICSNCSGFDMSWEELSGRGTLVSFRTPLHPEPEFESVWPYSNGSVTLDEGPRYGGMVLGIGPDDVEELYNNLPVQVQGEIQDRGDYAFIAFRVANDTV
jgi:uncharacterized OB-fold protein